jgi:tRNA modification GTPase
MKSIARRRWQNICGINRSRLLTSSPRDSQDLQRRTALFPSIYALQDFQLSINLKKTIHLAVQRRSLHCKDRTDSTIYALSTAPGQAAIAIIRISGPASSNVYTSLCHTTEFLKPRYASLRTLYEPDRPPRKDSVLDSNTLLLFFPAPKTVTGEDVLELHIHGGPAIIRAVLAAISKCGEKSQAQAIRYAEPGEFTRRAFLNGRLDLTQVEALGDALSATTEQQRRLSMRGTTNNLAKRYETWRQQLLYARGELEALIDFSEDQHFDESPAELCTSVLQQIHVLRRMLLAHCRNAMKGELLRNGVSITLLGAPNAGKSSLLNCIVGRQAAIVSHEPGTTRDVVEVGLDIGGYLCHLGDTAGLRKNTQDATTDMIGQVEYEGMRRAKERAHESDLVVVVVSIEKSGGESYLHLDSELCATAAQLVQEKGNVVVAVNKADTATSLASLESAIRTTMESLPGIRRERIHVISCKDATEGSTARMRETKDSDPGNMQVFLHGMIQCLGDLTAAATPDLDTVDQSGDPSVWQESLGASERHRLLLEKCLASLDDFIAEVDVANGPERGNDGNDADIVLAAEHLRAAADCLAKITGKGEAGDVEEVLGVIFEKFCVGK